MIILPDKVYETLKWICLIVVPAFDTFLMAVGPMIGIEDPEAIVKIINAIAAFVGVIIGVSTINYRAKMNKAQKAE